MNISQPFLLAKSITTISLDLFRRSVLSVLLKLEHCATKSCGDSRLSMEWLKIISQIFTPDPETHDHELHIFRIDIAQSLAR